MNRSPYAVEFAVEGNFTAPPPTGVPPAGLRTINVAAGAVKISPRAKLDCSRPTYPTNALYPPLTVTAGAFNQRVVFTTSFTQR